MGHEYGFWDNPKTWVGVAFFIFFILFGSKLWEAVTHLLDKRAQQVRAELAEAQKLRTEAEALLADAKARREQAMADAKGLMEGARHQAAQLAAAAAGGGRGGVGAGGVRRVCGHGLSAERGQGEDCGGWRRGGGARYCGAAAVRAQAGGDHGD